MTSALRLLIARDVSLNFLTYVASQRRTYILRPVFCHGKYLHYINLHVYIGALFVDDYGYNDRILTGTRVQ